MKASSFEKKDFCFNLRFPGQYYDSETGFYYNFHRYYMPEIGRYLRGDPAGGSGNYFYVNSNPVSFMDYSGLIPERPDVSCWIVCDWAHLPFEAGLVFHLLHCWLEWGPAKPGLATGNISWGMHGFDWRTRFSYSLIIGGAAWIMDRTDTGHGDRMGIFFYELPEDCCCRIVRNPPKPRRGLYMIGGTCNTSLSDYLKKVCPRVGYGSPPIEEGNMFGWGWWWGWSWRPVSYFF